MIASGFISPFYFYSGAIGLILALGYSGDFFSSGIRRKSSYLALAREQYPRSLPPLA